MNKLKEMEKEGGRESEQLSQCPMHQLRENDLADRPTDEKGASSDEGGERVSPHLSLFPFLPF